MDGTAWEFECGIPGMKDKMAERGLMIHDGFSYEIRFVDEYLLLCTVVTY